MKRTVVVAAVLLLAVSVSVTAQGQQSLVEVYKDEACGCCSKWVDHLRSHGFVVRATNIELDQLNAMKMSRGVPTRVRSCHTAIVGGYVVEGHVPAEDVKRLLKERPALVGIGVPGMPIGSPGMEVPGVKMQPFDVIGFLKDGTTRVFASHGR